MPVNPNRIYAQMNGAYLVITCPNCKVCQRIRMTPGKWRFRCTECKRVWYLGINIYSAPHDSSSSMLTPSDGLVIDRETIETPALDTDDVMMPAQYAGTLRKFDTIHTVEGKRYNNTTRKYDWFPDNPQVSKHRKKNTT